MVTKMRKHWLIQVTGLRRNDTQTNKLIKDIEAAGCTWSDIGVIPFTNEITNWANIPDEQVFVHCSTKVLEIFNSPIYVGDIFPGAPTYRAFELYATMRDGLFYNKDYFDQTIYSMMRTPGGRLFTDLVNGNCQVFSLQQALDERFNSPRFVKPGPDLKMFSGGLLEAGQSLRELLATQTVSSSLEKCMDDRVIFAPVQGILGEWRFFVVNDKVVTGSQYRKHGELKPQAYVPDYVLARAQELADMYQPADAFTIDLALTEDLELQIMEYNCINCSGVYEADVKKLALAIMELV